MRDSEEAKQLSREIRLFLKPHSLAYHITQICLQLFSWKPFHLLPLNSTMIITIIVISISQLITGSFYQSRDFPASNRTSQSTTGLRQFLLTTSPSIPTHRPYSLKKRIPRGLQEEELTLKEADLRFRGHSVHTGRPSAPNTDAYSIHSGRQNQRQSQRLYWQADPKLIRRSPYCLLGHKRHTVQKVQEGKTKEPGTTAVPWPH